ncbi:ankyrin repeat and ELMO domain-containing protein D-like [Oppia nitens]|uniref:ankyrin repeat and ELMO domain-containing protein D-like n=1 Tax=Oppia nitens TaxID=1686743 RepID=UPI0023DBB7E2|nr:ankyrin repeat and ELMO domain-containing protein D-like [Oppia nitens]XP_054168776.1 ankyrin repeat and ELMO domain-containing protein D-like [Oppia nitens]
MLEEIESAVSFLTRLITKTADHSSSSSLSSSSDVITKETIDKFSQKLCQLLEEKFRNHWFPDKPVRGQAFRCIRFNENSRRDSVVEKACQECGINFDDLKLPLELTLWVDPNEVTCRFGEHKGSYCIVAKLRDGRKENYIDSINYEELEQKTIERNRQASFDLLNSSRKRRNNQRKNGYNMNMNNNNINNNTINGYSSSNGGNNGFNDYPMGLSSSSSPLHHQQHQSSSSSSSSSFYPFYGSGTPFATHYSTSPPNNSNNNGYLKYPISPPQSRAVGGSGNGLSIGGNGSYRGLNINNNSNNKTNYANQSINNSKANNNINNNNNNSNNQNFSRQLFSGNSFQSPFTAYQTQQDRYHWVNKSIVKA